MPAGSAGIEAFRTLGEHVVRCRLGFDDAEALSLGRAATLKQV
jgi:hypothetical protein